jgi:hypothetical protein
MSSGYEIFKIKIGAVAKRREDITDSVNARNLAKFVVQYNQVKNSTFTTEFPQFQITADVDDYHFSTLEAVRKFLIEVEGWPEDNILVSQRYERTIVVDFCIGKGFKKD